MVQDVGRPSADSTIRVGDKDVIRFHPLHKRIKDGIPRCASCGQIDEDGYHDIRWCPATGGEIPFPTSTLKLTLKADSGFRSETTARITVYQWQLINMVLAADPEIVRHIADQHGNHVGTANTSVRELLTVEAFVDESGTAWTPPTAHAYYAVCRALKAKDARICELIAEQASA